MAPGSRPKGPVNRRSVTIVPFSISKRSRSGVRAMQLSRKWKTFLCSNGYVFNR
jgi:hypothetical protein